MSEHRYRGPDTSDKRDDECWVEYWNRKRRERHGENCGCTICESERLGLFESNGHGWCPHTHENNPEVIH